MKYHIMDKGSLGGLYYVDGNLDVDCYENICSVHVDGVQCIESTMVSSPIFKNTYYKKDGDVHINYSSEDPEELRITYYKMPELKKVELDDDGNEIVTGGNVMVPIEFLELVKAKLKATMYRNANEDELAAKWTALYNVKLENFKIWCENKRPKFGIV